jgi:MFS family permease
VAVAFMVALGFGVVAPAITPFAVQFGVSKAAAGAVISAFAFARLATAPFVGRMVNAFGERRLLGTGIGIVAVSSALAGLSQSYWQLLALRGAGGFGSIMFSVSSASLLYRVTPPEMRGRAQSVYAGGFLLGSIAGPALGVLAAISLRLPFFLYAGTLSVAGYIGLHALRSGGPAGSAGEDRSDEGAVRSAAGARREPSSGAPLTLREAMRNRSFVAALASTTSVQWSVVGIRASLVPLFVVGPLGLSREWSYICFFIVSVVTGSLLTPSGRRADTHNRLPMLAVGLVLEATALVLLPTVPNLGGLLTAMALLGAAGALLSVVPGAIVGGVVGARAGTVVATYQMAGDAGSVAGPLVAGFLADRYGYSASFYVAAAVVTIVPLSFVFRARGSDVRSPVPARAVVAGTTVLEE